MDVLLVLGCVIALVVPTLLGVGISLFLERFLGRRAYIVGAVLPLMMIAGFYAAYHILVRATACQPEGSLICEEPFATAFFLFLAVFLLALLANTAAQFAVYLALHPPSSPRAAPPTDGVPEALTRQETRGPASMPEAETEVVVVEEQPSEELAEQEQLYAGPLAPEISETQVVEPEIVEADERFAGPVAPPEDEEPRRAWRE